MKEFRLPLTPITEQTFIRQGWKRVSVNDFYEDVPEGKKEDENDDSHYWMIALPKDREDEYAPHLVSNASDDSKIIKEVGLKPGQFFVEMLDMDGLGFCKTEEELEILYRALTNEDINK
jgi:hypothetical protein